MVWQRQFMGGLMLAGLIFYVIMDLLMARTPGATISEITISLLWRHPVYAFAFGFIVSHLTWPAVTTRPHWQTICLVVFSLVTAALCDISGRIAPLMPIIPLVFGMAAGRMIWPQRTVSMRSGATEIETPLEITRVPEKAKTT